MASLIGNNFICESKTFVQHNDIIFFKMKDEINIIGNFLDKYVGNGPK